MATLQTLATVPDCFLAGRVHVTGSGLSKVQGTVTSSGCHRDEAFSGLPDGEVSRFQFGPTCLMTCQGFQGLGQKEGQLRPVFQSGF